MPAEVAMAQEGLPWQRILRNGSLLGLVLWSHLLLFSMLMSLRARAPDTDRPSRGSTDVMQIRLLASARPIPATPSHHEVNVRKAAARSVRQVVEQRPGTRNDMTIIDRVPPDAAGGIPAASAYPPAEANEYGDPVLRKALRDASSTRSQALPGADDGPLAGKFRVTSPRSLKDGVKALGNYMNCSIAEMARNRSGQLNVVRIADAYTALGCKK